MRIGPTLLALLLVLTISGCDVPLPAEKAAYAGEWRGESMVLAISRDGHLVYNRVKGSATTSINSPIKGFRGDDIEAGFGPFTTVFKVEKPPYRDGDAWKMVVDGVELTRTSRGRDNTASRSGEGAAPRDREEVAEAGRGGTLHLGEVVPAA